MNAQSSIIPFTFENSSTIRTILINHDPWFVVVDICNILNITNPSAAVKIIDEDSRAKFNLGRQGYSWIINESGLYTLILRCNDAIKPGTVAYKFRRWVTVELIPTIRKTGHYEMPAASTPALPKNELSEKDLHTIRDFIYSCSQTYTWGRCFSYAAWYALRKATGVKSPDKFEYKHMQTIIKELQRLQSITDYYHFTIAKIEQLLIKKIIREKGTPAELMEILNKMEMALNNDQELEKVRQIKGWQADRLMSLAS